MFLCLFFNFLAECLLSTDHRIRRNPPGIIKFYDSTFLFFFLICKGFDHTSSNLLDPKKKSIQLILLSSYLNCSMKMTLKSIKLLSEFFWNAGKKTWIENVAGQSLICLNWTVFIKGPSTFSLCQLTRTTVLSHNQPVKLLIRADFEGTTGASVLSHPKKKKGNQRVCFKVRISTFWCQTRQDKLPFLCTSSVQFN